MGALQDTVLRLEFSQCVEVVAKLKRRIAVLEAQDMAAKSPKPAKHDDGAADIDDEKDARGVGFL